MVINGLDAYIPKMMGTTDVCIDSFKTVGIPLFDNTTVLVANSASGYESIADVVEKTKAAPNTIEYAMKIGAANQIYGIAMNKEWGAEFKMMDVGNNSAKMTALLGQQTDTAVLAYALAKRLLCNWRIPGSVPAGSREERAPSRRCLCLRNTA